MKIKVSPPVNLRTNELNLFVPNLKYELPTLKIKRLKNSFVTYTGLVCNNKGLLKECHHSYSGQDKECLDEVSYYYHQTTINSENLIILDDDNTYLLIHHRWYNYYHWLNEVVLRLWMVKDETEKFILLLPQHYKNSKFVINSLEPFAFKNIYYIPEQKSALVKTLCMPQIKPRMECYNPIALRELRELYINYALEKTDKYVGDKIYLSRQKSRRRRVINEDEVVELLSKYKFNVINNEDYTFFEQVSIYSKAKYLISIHGAGLTNMLFMPGQSSVLEFHKKKTNAKDWHSLVFWYMADGLKHKYYHQICEPENATDPFFFANYIVDIELLKKNLQIMFPNEAC